jgi:transcriptional regulator with XRE-family HTH domain
MTNQATNFGKKIGETVKILRKMKKLSQEQMRQKADLSSGYLSRLEAGEYDSPSITHIAKMAQALDMSLRDLLEQAKLIPTETTFEGALRGEGANEEQIKQITDYKSYVIRRSNK